MANPRRQWGREHDSPFQRGPVKARPRKAAEDYSYHLLMLQERNRLLRKLCQKDPKEEALERKEQGFSLYLNGANMAPRRVQYPQHRGCTVQTSKTRRSSRTAGSPLRTDVRGDNLPEEQEVRSKTAPSKRKSWSHSTVEVKTQNGPTVPVAAPGIFSGCYDDDFESSAAEDGGLGESGEGVESEREGDRGGSGEGVESEREGDRGESEEEVESEREGDRGETGEGVESEKEGESGEEDVYSPSNEESLHTSHSTISVNQDSLSESNGELEEGEGEEEVLTVDGSSQLSTIMATQSLQSSPPTTHHPTPDREETTLAAATSGNILTAITERVKRLDSREQKELLELLNSQGPPLPPLLSATPQLPSHSPSHSPNWLRPDMTTGTAIAGHVQSRASDRPMSTWLTGLRGDMMRDTNEFAPRTTATNEIREQPTADRPSGRTSCLRGSLLGQPSGYPPSGVMENTGQGGLRPHPTTRPASDRLTGLRRIMASQKGTDKEASGTQPSSAPDLCRPEPRPDTAVLAQGHRPLRVGSHLVPLPSIATEKEREEFDIPVLPKGQQLVLSLLTTWGDQYYVGLTGIEIFTSSGERASIREISADPPDINILPEYSGDPRVVTNLLDGVNQTRDDLHMWLTPFTPSHPHTITITFTTIISLALLRIWNYNKSHVHSYRGVRDMEIWLDNVLIFKGEVSRASGGAENFGEMILFTTDEEILSRVGHHDDYFQTYSYGDFTDTEDNREVCLPNMEVGTEDEGEGEEEREGVGEEGQADHTELY